MIPNDDLQRYKELARQGDSNAQFNLALMYYRGEGVDKSLLSDFHWFQREAE